MIKYTGHTENPLDFKIATPSVNPVSEMLFGFIKNLLRVSPANKYIDLYWYA